MFDASPERKALLPLGCDLNLSLRQALLSVSLLTFNPQKTQVLELLFLR